MNYARTEDFFRMFHPNTTNKGNIVLERKMGKSFAQSQISTLDLERVSKVACGLEDIYFSTTTFLGRPLLLNFARSNCLHLQIPISTSQKHIHITAKLRLEEKGIPLPTAVIFDGEHYTFLWILETPIEDHEFYIHTMLQQALFEAAIEFNPTERNLETIFLTRMIGSINSKTKQNVGLISDYGRSHSKQYLQQAILNTKTIQVTEYQKFQTQAGITLELLSLLGDRWFSASQSPEMFEDWIIFFGSSLCNFCTPTQMFQELSAIAESLENKPWGTIKHLYSDLITSIIKTSKEGYIRYKNIHLSIDGCEWREMIKGKLLISTEEIKHLNLQVLGNQSLISPLLHIQSKSIRAVGNSNFVPIERLLLKVAA